MPNLTRRQLFLGSAACAVVAALPAGQSVASQESLLALFRRKIADAEACWVDEWVPVFEAGFQKGTCPEDQGLSSLLMDDAEIARYCGDALEIRHVYEWCEVSYG